jgi:hypothetical protein
VKNLLLSSFKNSISHSLFVTQMLRKLGIVIKFALFLKGSNIFKLWDLKKELLFKYFNVRIFYYLNLSKKLIVLFLSFNRKKVNPLYF